MEMWIGQRLDYYRLNKRLSQKALASVVGRGQTWMSEVLNGATEPGFHEVEAMLRELGISLEEVVKNPGKLQGVTVTFSTWVPEGGDGQAAQGQGSV
jgi:transcriptional regulator with XRE-family HTH domain